MKAFLILTGALVLAAAPAAAQTITAAEYFINTDPGLGNGTAIEIPEPGESVSLSVLVPAAELAALPDGAHSLVARVRDETGNWGIAFARSFHKSNSSLPTPVAPIVAAEYYINEDPGPGNGTPIPVIEGETAALAGQVPPAALAALPDGTHQFTARVMDADGNWSIAFSRPFNKRAEVAPSASLIARITYRWYQDNAPVSEIFELIPEIPGNPVSFQELASLAGLSEGETYQLVFTPFDDLGNQGFAATREVEVETIDSNGDGIPDQWKLAYGFGIMDDIADLDTDGDGLTNREEFLLGTHPLMADTSGDGILDGLAVRLAVLGIDPLVNDPELVAALRLLEDGPGNGEMFTRDQLQALALGHPTIGRDQESGEFTLRIGLKKSTDLQTFLPFSFEEPGTVINQNGEIEFRFSSGEKAEFYQLEAR